MRVRAQCPLCSSDAQTLFSGLAVLRPRLAQIVYCDVTGALRPSSAGLSCGSQFQCSENFAIALFVFPWMQSMVWEPHLCFSCWLPQAFIKSDYQGHKKSFRPLTGRGRSQRFLGAQNGPIRFSHHPTGATLASSQLFCCWLAYLCLTGDQRVVLKTLNLISHSG